jgi:TRAP transporter TAXI family solute receptor
MLGTHIRRLLGGPKMAALLAAGMVIVTVVLLVVGLHKPSYELRLSAGDSRGRRHAIAETLADESRGRRVSLKLLESAGSEEALAGVQLRRLDVALIQGGLEPGRDVREVAPLVLEMMHVLVAPQAEIDMLDDLRGKRLDLSTKGSGTHTLALQVLSVIGLSPGSYTEVSHSYDQLMVLPDEQLADAIFHVSSLPSTVADFLIDKRGYRLLELPVAHALALRNRAVRPAEIPPYSYRGSPAEPAKPLATVATRMMLVAHKDIDEDAVRLLVEVATSDRFARQAELSLRDGEELLEHPELALHRGTLAHLRRDDRLLRPETIDNLESLRSFFVSLVVAIILGARWLRARQLQGFEDYMKDVNALETRIIDLEQQASPDIEQLLQIRRRLGRIKVRGLTAYTNGEISSADQLSSFLLHVNDVRDQVDDLLLHARERIEDRALRGGSAAEEELVSKLWAGATGDEPDTRG